MITLFPGNYDYTNYKEYITVSKSLNPNFFMISLPFSSFRQEKQGGKKKSAVV